MGWDGRNLVDCCRHGERGRGCGLLLWDEKKNCGLLKMRCCGEPAISLHSYRVPLVQWSTRLLPVMRDPGSIRRGYLCETGILLLALSRYIGDPEVIDHCGLVWGRLHLELSLGRCADNGIILLDLTQLFCSVLCSLQVLLPASQPTKSAAGGGGEPCGGPAISLHSFTVPVVQWSTRLLPIMRDPGSISRGYLRETRILLLALSYYNVTEGKLWVVVDWVRRRKVWVVVDGARKQEGSGLM